MQLVEREHDGLRRGQRVEPGGVGAAELPRELLRPFVPPVFVVAEAEEPAERPNDLGRIECGQPRELRPQLRAHRHLRLARLDLEPAPEHVDERPVQDLAAVRPAVALQPDGPATRDRAQLTQHPGLADPGLAHEKEHLPAAFQELVQPRPEAPDLGLAVDERSRRGLLRRLLHPDETPGGDGLLTSLDVQLSERLEHEAMRQAPRGRAPHDDGSRRGGRLQAGGDVRDVTERHHVLLGAADETDCCLAAVDADPDVEVLDSPGGGHVTCVLGDHLEDPDGRVRRPFRIVLVRSGHPEEGCDPVSHVGVDGAAVLLDRAGHAADALADERLHLVRCQSLAEGGRADDVGEQGGDGAQLVDAAGRRDLVGTSGLRGGRVRPLGGDDDAAVRAEPSLARDLRVALRTSSSLDRDDGGPADRRRGLERRRRRVGLDERLGLVLGHGRARRLHLHGRLAEPNHVSGSEPHGRLDPALVDPCAVERVEILDLDCTVPRAHERVPAGDLRIVDDDVGVSAPQHELGLDDQFVARKRASRDEQRGHGAIVLWAWNRIPARPPRLASGCRPSSVDGHKERSCVCIDR